MNEKEIQTLLEKILGLNSKVIHPLIGGMMNRSFVVEDNNHKKYVLYISTPEANELVNRHLEKDNQNLVNELGITSKNIYFDTKTGIKINEYIEGSSLDKIDTFSYDKLAVLFHTLHNSKTLSKEDYNPFVRFEGYVANRKKYHQEDEKEYLDLIDLLFKNKSYLESQTKKLCHNDAQRSNIIKTPNDNYYFIDFEFMGNNDPIYDIATFGNGDVKEGRTLLDYYFNFKPSKDEIKRYYLWRIYISLQWYNVAISKHYQGEGATHGFNFLDVATHFLNNALNAKQGYIDECL